MTGNNFKDIDALIFDVTGTIIDSSESYLRAIESTANNYLKKTVVTQGEIRRIKGVIGFNNEWDTTYALVRLVQEKIPSELWEVEAQKMLPIDRTGILFKELYNMFQTSYLGSELFATLENEKPPFPYSPGLITLEKSYVDKEIIASLKKKGYKLGIATGCPVAEVLITLKKQGLLGKEYFEEQHIVGREDTPKLKPDPAPLLEAKRRLDAINPIYIGDNISDVEASRRANMPCMFLGDLNQNSNKNDTIINQLLQMFLKI